MARPSRAVLKTECFKAGYADAMRPAGYVMRGRKPEGAAPLMTQSNAGWSEQYEAGAIEALRQSESLFRDYFNLGAFAMAIVSRDNRWVAINDRFCEMFGYTREELKSLTWRDLTHPEDLAASSELVQQLRSGEIEKYTVEKRYLRKGGQVINAEISVAAIHDAQGGVEYIIGHVQDVTGRKEAETALRSSQEAMESIFRAAPVGIGLVLSRVITKVNDRMCQILGRSSGELVGQSSRVLYASEEEYLRVGQEKYRQIAEHGIGTVETRWVRRDGTLIDVLLSSSPLDLGNLSAGVTFTALDITERKAAEEALRLTQYTVDNVGEAAFWIRPDGSFAYINEATCRQLGYTREELLSMNVADIDPDFPAERWPGHWARTRLLGTLTIESQHRRKDGTTLPVEIRVHHLTFDGQEYHFAFARDITQRKHLEAQLIQAQKMEAVGQLAGGIAHDFNNQLTVIEGYADILLHGLGDNDPRHLPLKEIKRAGERAHRVTSQLLAFSRKQALRPEVLDLNRVLFEMHEPLSRMLGEKIQISLLPGRDLKRTRLDRAQLEQAVMNLVINARDAMAEGGKVTLETANVMLDEAYAAHHLEVSPGPHVMLSVSDTGCGMDEKTRQQIFEPFFTTKEVGEGTGLGLSMVYGFVRQSGGSVSVDSQPGRGATFRLLFPVTWQKAPGDRPAGAAEMPGGSETILVVEDEHAVRRFVVSVLRRCGYTVLEAGDPAAAMAVVAEMKDRIDLLVSDIVMPGMNGAELSQKLHDVRPEMRVLFMSGYASSSDIPAEVQANGQELLTKPFEPEVLAAAARRILDHK